MEIILYRNLADPRVLDKRTQMSTIATVQAKVYYPLNILSPSFSLKYSSAHISANYCYITDFGRYYFLSEPVLDSGEVITFTGQIDSIMSYRIAISNLDCVCLTSQYDFNEYIPHDIPSTSKATITNYRFGNFSFKLPEDETDLQYVMMLNGLAGDP